MKNRLMDKVCKILTVVAVAASIGMSSGQVFAGEPEVNMVEGNIVDLNMRSGYFQMSEEKILFDSKTPVQNQKEEPLSLKDLKEGLPATVFFEKRKFSNKALMITIHQMQQPKSKFK